ncbi:hypothetical protein SteCoe_19939 [Stentor coeruleus]|uniref:Uncharacterized protein n=1 Tax=Stentor coeruleus TaxID=5963 RepID=A0A1R2BSW2_9CILI|nr:hypothetical protein SteCoe_19939 [Stentor coeruleus]
MSTHRVNLRLPLPGNLIIDKSSLIIPKSTQSDSETSSITDSSPLTLITYSSLQENHKSLPSSEKLKFFLQNASEKIKSIHNNTDTSKITNDSYNNNNEILKLRKEISKLEAERNELLEENKEMWETIKKIKEHSVCDVELSRVLKYAHFFTLRVKKSCLWKKSFCDIFDSEELMYKDIKSENLKKTCLDLLQFILENFTSEKGSDSYENSTVNLSFKETTQPEIPVNEYHSMLKNDEILNICNSSETLAESISLHKQKIQQIYESLKDSVNKSKEIMHSSPVIGKGHNLFSHKLGNSSFDFEYDEEIPIRKTF